MVESKIKEQNWKLALHSRSGHLLISDMLFFK